MSVAEESAPPTGADVPLRRNRDFLLLWSGAGMALLGTRVSAISYPLLVLWSTGNAASAGLVGFAAQLPSLLVQLPAGALVDRWDRRRLMIACNAGGFLALASVAVAVVCGRLWLTHLMAAAFIESSLTIFYRLSERAAVRNLVPPHQLPAALSQNEARGRAAALLGQSSGSLLFALTRWVPLAFTALSHLFALTGLLLIRRPLQADRPARRRALLPAVADGFGWLWRQRFLRAVMFLIAGSNIVQQGLTLAVLLIVREGGGSAALVAVIVGLRGLGGTLGALSGTWWLRRLSVRAIVIGGNAVWAAVLPLIVVVRDPYALAVIFAVSSYVGGAFNVAGGVYQVGITPDALQGRVNSVMDLIGSGALSLGSLFAGFLLESQGVTRTAAILSAAMAAVAASAVISPAVRHHRTPPPTPD